MRTAGDGRLESVRVGRRTCWTLTPAAERLLVDGTRRIYGFTGAYRGGGPPADTVRQAWDLAATEAAYAQFHERFDTPLPGDTLTGTLELLHAGRRFDSKRVSVHERGQNRSTQIGGRPLASGRCSSRSGIAHRAN